MNEDLDLSAIDHIEGGRKSSEIALEDSAQVLEKFHCFICQAGFRDEAGLTEHEKTEQIHQMKAMEKDKKSDCDEGDLEGDMLPNHSRHIENEHTVDITNITKEEQTKK